MILQLIMVARAGSEVSLTKSAKPSLMAAELFFIRSVFTMATYSSQELALYQGIVPGQDSPSQSLHFLTEQVHVNEERLKSDYIQLFIRTTHGLLAIDVGPKILASVRKEQSNRWSVLSEPNKSQIEPRYSSTNPRILRIIVLTLLFIRASGVVVRICFTVLLLQFWRTFTTHIHVKFPIFAPADEKQIFISSARILFGPKLLNRVPI